jgi:hypothetical protein
MKAIFKTLLEVAKEVNERREEREKEKKGEDHDEEEEEKIEDEAERDDDIVGNAADVLGQLVHYNPKTFLALMPAEGVLTFLLELIVRNFLYFFY